MVHLSTERLADLAIDHSEELRRAELDHLAGCASCQRELDALHQIVRAACAPVEELQVPPERVWVASRAEIQAMDGVASPPVQQLDQRSLRARPVPSRRSVRTRPRKGLAILVGAVALVVGLARGAVAAGALSGQRAGQSELLASAELVALPGKVGHGTARLVVVSGVPQVQVELAAPTPGVDYREVWLLDSADHTRMYSLGDLDDRGTGTFTLPPGLDGRLGEFTVVDVSEEPYDGNSAHSGNSVVRGSLP